MLLDCLLSLIDHLYTLMINYSKFIIYNILHQFSFFFSKIFSALQNKYIAKFISIANNKNKK